jgi:DNA-binding response OmpR family regulator
MTMPDIRNGVIAAENDSQMRGLLRSVLTHVGQQVFPAADGEEAVALARQFKARLVLLDVAMPRLNGLQACDLIRKLPGYADVPIVMLTGYDEDRLRAAARRFGATEFITKPFRPNMLLSRLVAYLDIPAEMLPAMPSPDGSGDAALGVRAMPWNVGKAAAPVGPENASLANGRDVVRIWRSAAGTGVNR